MSNVHQLRPPPEKRSILPTIATVFVIASIAVWPLALIYAWVSSR